MPPCFLCTLLPTLSVTRAGVSMDICRESCCQPTQQFGLLCPYQTVAMLIWRYNCTTFSNQTLYSVSLSNVSSSIDDKSVHIFEIKWMLWLQFYRAVNVPAWGCQSSQIEYPVFGCVCLKETPVCRFCSVIPKRDTAVLEYTLTLYDSTIQRTSSATTVSSHSLSG